ncbi:MAG: hypothetical protein PX636_04520 [Microcystis sp. M53598_WE2]|uniref:PspA/IM30 family protein n=1 Tax=Microcystis sp. M53598_WE2 TaxID=3030677 RepID=UPI0025875E51|nr:hypothetical protein [Microcystis sp. M53598_WE2]MDJ0670256.1 hypothetical protein [Microcystis sp. M53598_WE2]
MGIAVRFTAVRMSKLTITIMRDDLSNLRSSIIEVIALQKRAEQQYNQAQAEVLKW